MRRVIVSHRTTLAALLIAIVFLVLWRGGKSVDATWLLGGLAVGLSFVSFMRPRETAHSLSSPRCGYVLLLLGLFTLWTIVSFLLSTTRNYGLDEVVQTVSCVLLVVWVLFAPSDDRRMTLALARALSLALLIACAAGVLVYLYQPVTRFVGTFFDARFHTDYWPNAWAEFILLVWPMLLMVLLKTRSGDFLRCRRHDALRAVVLGLVFGCLLLSYSRGAFIACAGQFILLIGLACYRYRCRLPWRALVVSTILVGCIGGAVFWSVNFVRSARFPLESVLAKATFSAGEGASSVSERQQFFRQSFALSLERPLFGWGPYSFRFVQPHQQEGVLETSDHPHNIVLKYAMERGWPAAILFLLLLLVATRRGLASLADDRSTNAASLSTALFLLVSVAGVLAHCLIDFNLQFVAIALPFWLSLALLFRVGSPSLLSVPTYVRFAVVGVAGFLLLTLLIEGVHLWNSSLARHAEIRGDVAGALRAYERTDLSFFSRDGWLSRSMMLLREARYSDAENALLLSLHENAEDARTWRILGDVYAAWSKNDEALRAYEKAYTYGRWNDAGTIRGLLSGLRSQRSDLRVRRAEIDAILVAYERAIERNTHFIALGQNVESAVALATDLARIFPEDAGMYASRIDAMQTAADRERSRLSSRPRGLLW